MSPRLTFLALLPLIASSAHAVGFGELRSQPVLGQPLSLEVEIFGNPRQLEPGCFSLRPASVAGDAPNLRQARFKVRKDTPAVLEIHSAQPVREPVLQFALRYTCEQDIQREYVVLASPPAERTAAEPVLPTARAINAVSAAAGRSTGEEAPPLAGRPRPSRPTQAPVERPRRNAGVAARPVGEAQPERPRQDRLMLSGGGEIGEPNLRIASGLAGDPELVPTAADAERARLRLEYRMLGLMAEMATTPASAPERLRELEVQLQQLRQEMSPPAPAVAAPPAPQPPAPAAKPAAVTPPPEPEDDYQEYALFGALGLLLAGLLIFLRRRSRSAASPLPPLEEMSEPQLAQATEGNRGKVQLAPTAEPIEVVEPEAAPVLPEDDYEPPEPQAVPEVSLDLGEPAAPAQAPLDEGLQFGSVDEQFEANPVMELADIMLSFGRVKGAAQALQEYVDKNPQEALQPWIRLLEIYRMAGMREEFELVARNLNKNFNVEVLQWDDSEDAQPLPADNGNTIDFMLDSVILPASVAVTGPPKARSLEDMPRLMNQICEQWGGDGVLEQLQLLLRDNRGGQRLGFSLPVIDEILFLIELKETLRKINQEAE